MFLRLSVTGRNIPSRDGVHRDVPKSARLAVVCVALVVVAPFAVAATSPPPIAAQVETEPGVDGRLEAFMARVGGWAYVLAPLFMIAVAILPIPAEIPALVNGMLFGTYVGTAITWLGAIIGAAVSFELARRFGRPLVSRLLPGTALAQVDRLMESAGWPGLLFLRLIPTVAFTAINWGAGLTSVCRRTFWWTTAIGILPGAFGFTVLGSGLAAVLRTYPGVAWMLAGATGFVVWWTVARYRRPSPGLVAADQDNDVVDLTNP